jgi:hypothetical protein
MPSLEPAVSDMEHFLVVSFGIIVGGHPAVARKLPNASVDVELQELQENIQPQQNRPKFIHDAI